MAENDKQDKQPKASGAKVAKYVGTADVRSIDANAWKSIGVEDQGKVTWDSKNKFEVPASELNATALKYLDETDTGFVVEDAKS